MATVNLKCTYRLTKQAHRALALAGTPTTIVQSVSITVDAEAAVDRKLAKIDDDGMIEQNSLVGPVMVLEYGCDDAQARNVRTYESDHVLSPEEATEVYESAWNRTVRVRELERAANVAKAEALEVTRMEVTDTIRNVMPRLEAGEGTIDTGFPHWYRLDGRIMNLRGRSDGIEIATEVCEQLRSIRVAREAAEEAKKLAREKAIADERAAWIGLHGSPRLRKGLAAGMVGSMVKVYTEERLFRDIGEGWKLWADAPEQEDNDLLNPTEDELDTLEMWRSAYPDGSVRLRSVGGLEDEDGYKRPWRAALFMDCPWDKSYDVILFLRAE